LSETSRVNYGWLAGLSRTARYAPASAATATALIAVLLIGASVLPSAAQEPPPPIATEFLTGRAVFADQVDHK
jgi:hypothetical protein